MQRSEGGRRLSGSGWCADGQRACRAIPAYGLFCTSQWHTVARPASYSQFPATISSSTPNIRFFIDAARHGIPTIHHLLHTHVHPGGVRPDVLRKRVQLSYGHQDSRVPVIYVFGPRPSFLTATYFLPPSTPTAPRWFSVRPSQHHGEIYTLAKGARQCRHTRSRLPACRRREQAEEVEPGDLERPTY